MNARLQRLRAEVAADLEAFDTKVATLAELDIESDNDAVKAQAALALHHAYGAVESAFERVTRAAEGGVPAGERWHQDLLDGMALEVSGVRPAFLDTATLAQLHELLGFRHFVRHAYRVDLDAARLAMLRSIAVALRPPLHKTFADVDGFLAQLGE